ncbi:NADH-quinone oxidoreductase subunit J [Thalassotalea fusca]
MQALLSLSTLFYLAAFVAVYASLRVVLLNNTVHALLYLVVSLLAVAVCFYLLGAPFAAGLEVIVYAGAILVLFVFAIMMFGLREDETRIAPKTGQARYWLMPSLLVMVLFVEMVYVITLEASSLSATATTIASKEVGAMLYGPYLLAVELASFLLLAGLVAGYHFAKSFAGGGR